MSRFTSTEYVEFIPLGAPDLNDDWHEATLEIEWDCSAGTKHTLDHPGDPTECDFVNASVIFDDGKIMNLEEVGIPLSLSMAFICQFEDFETNAAIAFSESEDDPRY